jgi:hypothetical protein
MISLKSYPLTRPPHSLRSSQHFKDDARDRREQGDWYTQYVEMEEAGGAAPSPEIVYDIIPEGVKKQDVGGGIGIYGNSVVAVDEKAAEERR